MAAYGLYTHIASNKFRSMLLLGGLFLLIYVLVYAGALLGEVFVDNTRAGDVIEISASAILSRSETTPQGSSVSPWSKTTMA